MTNRSTRLIQHTGTVRRATHADGPALAQLLACTGTDNLPIAPADVASLLDHGHLLVLDVGAGALGAAAYVEPIETATAHRAVVRYLAVHPALASGDLRCRMTSATRDLCAGLDAVAIEQEPVPDELVRVVRGEIARRFTYLMMFLLALPRVLASMGHNGVAVAALVWSALALFTAARTPRIPRAIVHRRRGARLLAWTDAALLRFGELPVVSYAPHALPPPWTLAAGTPNEQLARLSDTSSEPWPIR
jgi:hypothetical protein